MQKFEYCAVYQVTQMEGWLNSVGMAYKSDFTEQGATRQDLDHHPDVLAKVIAKLGNEGWEMVGTGVVSQNSHTIYFKRPLEA